MRKIILIFVITVFANLKLIAMENKIIIKLEHGNVEIELFNDIAPNHVERFNDSIKAAANLNNIELLPVSDEIWSDISKRTYSLKKDYDSNAIPLMRRIFSGIYHHYLFKKSWNDIAKVKGQWILFDQIHLNERGAEIVFKLVKKFISKN